MRVLKQLGAAMIAVFLSISVTAEGIDKGVIDNNLPNISYVQFKSLDPLNPNQPLTISGQLRLPMTGNQTSDSAEKLPAVVILHGSAGVDSRGSFYIDALNQAGIATLEIDMWAARGLAGGIYRPPLPTLTVPDAFAALNYLAEQPAIDPQRIAIMGFSWGGVMSMLSATQHYTGLFGGDHQFAAHVAHYPVCWAYNVGVPGMVFNNLTGSPLLIQVGDRDDYDEGSAPCENLIATLSPAEQAVTSLKSYPNSYHAWDRLQPGAAVYDPFSHLGMGGEVKIVPNPGTANQSRKNAVRFLRQALRLE